MDKKNFRTKTSFSPQFLIKKCSIKIIESLFLKPYLFEKQLVRKSQIRSYYSQISSLFNFYLLNRESLRLSDMSLVVIANTTSNQEQFSKFIDELKGVVASYNSSLESEGQTAATKIDLNAFISKARTLLDQDNLSGLLAHILTLGTALINDLKSIDI